MAKAGGGRSWTSTARSCSAASTRSSRKCALQNLPVTFALDRAGLTGPDGPTHHGVLRHPVHAAVPEHGRAWPPATRRTSRRCCTSPWRTPGRSRSATRRRTWRTVDAATSRADRAGQGRGDRVGRGRLLRRLRHAAVELRQGRGEEAARRKAFDVGVINARFVKPLDKETILRAVENAAARRDGGGRHARRRLRLARCWKRRTRAGLDTRNVRPAAASRTASSSTASAASCSPTSG